MLTKTVALPVLLGWVAEEVRPRLLDAGFGLDSCVAATRIALDVLHYFGESEAQPYSVICQAWNMEGVDLLREHDGDGVAVGRLIREIPVERAGGPWNVGIGVEGGTTRGPDDPGAGHVIVGFPHRGYILDVTLDQASRPHKNMLLTSYWFPARTEWFTDRNLWEIVPYPVLRGLDALPVDGEVEQDEVTALLIYSHAPARYVKSPNWRRTTSSPGGARVFREITGASIRAIRERIDAEG